MAALAMVLVVALHHIGGSEIFESCLCSMTLLCL